LFCACVIWARVTVDDINIRLKDNAITRESLSFFFVIQYSVKNQLNLYKIIGYKFRIQRRNYTTYIHEEQVKLLMLGH